MFSNKHLRVGQLPLLQTIHSVLLVMLKSLKHTSLRLTQITNHISPYTRTMTTLNTQLKLNTGASIREFTFR